MEIKKKNYLRFIFIFLVLLNNIYSEDTCGCTAVNSNDFSCTSTVETCNCKFKYSNSCHDCSLALTNSDTYYSIDASGVCSNQCVGNKIIEQTKECTSVDLPNTFYHLGDVYYKTNPSNTDIECQSNNACKCKKYYYITDINGKQIYNCFSEISTPPEGYSYYNFKTGEFLKDDCPNGLKITKTVGALTRCSDSCLSDEYYESQLDENSILRESCKDDNTCNSDNKGLYILNGIKKCINCADMNLYEKNHICVTLDNCDFYSENKCYTDCNSHNSNKFYNFGNKECILQCTGEYLYKDSDNTNKICYKREQCNYLDIEAKICYSQCPTGSDQKSYHEYDSNICISNCALSNKNYLYHIPDGYICYPSCSSIPGNYIYELDNHICKDTLGTDECDYYVIKNNGIKRCLAKDTCISNGYSYFIKINSRYECRESCDGYYKRKVVETSPALSFTLCYEDLTKVFEDSEVKYYHIKSKICWNDEPSEFEYFIKSSSTTTSPKEIVEECENFYYENSGKNYCIAKCSEVSGGYFFVSKNKKCENSCTAFSKYYYDPDSKECLDSCKGRSKGFQNKISSTPQACLSSCTNNGQNVYYSYDSNICINGCGNDGSNNLYHKDDETICYPSCLSIADGSYFYEFSDKTCKNDDDDCGYHFQENGVIKCFGTSLTECKNKNYMYLIGEQCASSCDNNKYKYEDNTALAGSIFIRCFDSPNDCLTNINPNPTRIYYNTNLKFCWIQMQNNLYVNDIIDTNKYELVEECDKFFYEDSEGNNHCYDACQTGTGTNLKKYFVSGNKKCSTSCDEFGKYYYDPSNNECLDTCKGRPNFGTQKEHTNPLTIQECLSNCEENNGEETIHYYYNYDSNICMDYCGKDGSYKKYHADGGYICYSSCFEIPGDYKYAKQTQINTPSPYIDYTCYSSSASSNCPYYYLNSDDSKKCQQAIDCFNMNYIYLIANSNSQSIECKYQCDDYYKLDETISIGSQDKQFIKCFQDYTDCYSHINSGGGTPTNYPIYYNEKAKRCWKTPPDYYYIIDNSDDSNIFKVVEKCDKFYYIDNGNNKHCTSACKIDGSPGLNLYFVDGNQKCANNCGEFGKYYYDPTNNECLDTCLGKEGKEFSVTDTSNIGYYKCSSGCATSEFYDYDSKICIAKCGNDKENYLYHTAIGSNDPQNKICYPSCKDIPNGDYIYESQEGSNNIKTCTTTIPTVSGECDYYYMKEDGTLKCLADYNACLNMNYNYLLGKECKSKCNDYYILEDVNTNGLKKCFKDKDECANSAEQAKYYSSKLKKCWKNYPTDYFILKEDLSPGDSPTITGYEMTEKCEHFYYKDQNNKYCTDNCKTLNPSKFFTKGKQNCEDSCINFHKYYFQTNNNECVDICIGNEFADKIDLTTDPVLPKPCLQSCTSSNEYYNYGTKICISNCNSNSDGYIYTQHGDSNKICYNSCAQIPGNSYIYEFGNVCYKKEELSSINCPYYFLKDDGSMKCINRVSDCKTNNFDYLYGQECRRQCDGYYILQDETGSNIPKECFLTLSEALQSSKNIKYYNQNHRQCWIDYPSNFYIKSKDNNDNWEVIENCDKFYYEKEITGTTSYKYCVDNCKIDNTLNLYFIQNQQKCETTCSKYYDPENNECLETCIGRTNLQYSNPIPTPSSPQPCLYKCPNYFITKKDASNNIIAYECIDECSPTDSDNNYNYIDVKSNECLSNCPTSNTIEVNGKCYPKCGVDNDFRYINTDTYECVLACPSYLKKMEYLTKIDNKEIYLCKSMCQEGEYRLEEKCFTECPEGYNYIGNNNICKYENCNGDLNGQKYYKIKEITKDSSTYPIYKCINSCQDTQQLTTPHLFHEESNPNKCIDTCLGTSFIFDYSCLSKCPDNYPFYNLPNKECLAENICNDNTDGSNYFSNGLCVTKSNCPSDVNGKKYINSKNICIDKCRDDEYNEKDDSDNSIILCKKDCDKYKYQKDSESVLECLRDCPEDKHFIGKNNICKHSCEEEDGINYYEIEPIDSTIEYKIYFCVTGCPEPYSYRLANNDNQCYQNCPDNYPYKSEEDLKCYSNCLESSNPFTLNKYDSDHITIIPDKCDKQCNINTDFKYFGKNKICITDCSILGDTKIANCNNECVEKCDLQSNCRFQLDNKCTTQCEEDDPLNTNPIKKRYSLRDYICKEKCDDDENIVKEGEICTNSCQGFLNPLNADEYECVSSCSGTINPYYYETEKKCLSQCNNGDKVVEGKNICVINCDDLKDKKYYLYEKDVSNPNDFNKCVLNCPSNKPYIYEDKCLISCPSEKKYFIGEITNEDHYKCKNDCPISYPFYKITQNEFDNSIENNICIANCVGFYVPNSDSNIIATLCLNSCPDSNNIYKYQIINNGENKCYKVCPPEARYHFDLDTIPTTHTDNNCYTSCPNEAPFHKRGETICLTLAELDNLGNGYILYEEKEWTNTIGSCPYGLTTKAEPGDFTLTNTILICSNECTEYGKYLTPYNTCVKDCENSYLVNGMNLRNDEYNKKCVCKGLFYIDENSHQKICYPNTITSCLNTNNDYKIPLKPTNECLKFCSNDRILNPSEDECYETGTNCLTINVNTKLVTVDGKKKCDCAYKFYYDSNGKKICLGENDICPQSKKKYYPDTMQCIENCQSDYTFKNYCLKECPAGSTINEGDKICDCGDRFWYKASEGNYECLNEGANCLDSFPLYSGDKECLKSCKNTYYPYYFENKCHDKCEIQNSEIVEVPNNSPLTSYAKYKCDCLRPWYYEIDSVINEYKMKCPSVSDGATIKECKNYRPTLNIINMIEETRQCVDACPSKYKYLWNELCFINCEYANDKYKFNIETEESSLVCKCQNLWHKNTTDTDKKICYEKTRDECPTETEPNNYLIYNTKECVDDYNYCPPNSFKFNHICYDKCPEFTLEGTNGDNDCVCDKSHLWLKYKKYGNIYYKCGLETCPETSVGDRYIRKNLLERENQCVRNCEEEGPADNDYLYSFRGKCVKECPTKTNQVNGECLFYDVKSPGYVNNLDDLKEKANIQAKELYKDGESFSGFIMHDFGASLQIYALNKINSNKELAMQSNLTYIDLGTCLDKIYADNNLNDNDSILVTKFDLLSRTHKTNNGDGNGDNTGGGGDATSPTSGNTYTDDNYLINQVEYEFYLQSTNKKLEGSICSPYEIEISYPIFYNKNKYDNYQSGKNYNNYLKQFMIGKDLHSKNSEIDTFNKDNKVYKDMCIGVEINGKDLVLEERYDYLYPNNVSLCESNCTMKNTDFDLQRINCMCTYKEIMDFKRIDEDNNDILNDPDFDKPSQSSANAQIIKCITKIGIKEGLINNEAFYFCMVGSFFIVVMSIVSAFTAVKGVASFMNGMLKLNGANNAQSLKNNFNIATSANRLINNPPKKGELNETKDKNNDNEANDKGNIVIKKNIKLNYNTKNDTENDVSEISINNDNINNKTMNYGLNIKSTIPKNRKKLNNTIIRNNFTQYQTQNEFSNKKAEFIPPEYNFKFFKPGDKGVVKKILRSEIPFEIDKDTKILLEGKKGILYDENYLEGPFYEEQNIIEIIDGNQKNNDDYKNNKIIKFNDNNSKNAIKNNSKIDIIGDISIKQENENTKKRCITNEANATNKEFIKITKINPIKDLKIAIENYKTDDEIKEVDSTTSIYNLMKREHTFLRVTYEKYVSKNHPNILATFLAEILDKIYLVKIFIFLKKFEILSIQFSLYIFYHILVLSLLCGFFTINTIKKIWEESNYPTINFYLLYGLISHIIIWIIYRIFILVLDNQDKIRALVKQNNEIEASKESLDENLYSNQKEQINEKYKELMKKIKIQILVFYIVVIALTALCFIYLVSFFAIYTGTKSKVFKAYYISLIEIVLIKFVYGLCLGALRIAADGNELKGLYNFVYIFDKYIS